MRLSCFEYGIDLLFQENQVNVLVLENQQMYSGVLGTILQQIAGEEAVWQLFDGDKELQINKCVTLVHSPFLLDVNSKKYLTFLYKEMQIVVDEFCEERVGEINATIVNCLDAIAKKLSYPVNFNLDLSMIDIFKLYDVHFDFQESTMMERILNFIQLEKVLFGTKLIIFVNLKDYLDDAQMQEIYKSAFYNKMPLLLIEAVKRDCLSEEKYCIIDKDKCVINL